MTMRQSFTAVIERNATLAGEFTTEPYEAAWAREARWFVRVLGATRRARMLMRTQISPDGLHWCDLDGGTEQSVDPGEGPLHSWPAAEFGGWLRLRGTVVDGPDGPDGPADALASVKVLIYLALKS
ncbi:hypothetical protein [Streptomyces synnematoformans]|uniref:Uncharacterized protein n=1 Tax=Streptomyces synnematoformans TaxID=415721 RepID=A0ABN2Y2Q2_9ACTN